MGHTPSKRRTTWKCLKKPSLGDEIVEHFLTRKQDKSDRFKNFELYNQNDKKRCFKARPPDEQEIHVKNKSTDKIHKLYHFENNTKNFPYFPCFPRLMKKFSFLF